MMQDAFLFTGTVRDNIRYGRLDASDVDIERAARAVRAHEFIEELPEGYDTMVEERGSTLSAGQRQLIAFARVLLSDPRILILDEATSNIDTRTEEALQAGSAHLLRGRTSFVIAHRLSTIVNADEIMVVDRGQIIERGTHDELMAQRGFYWRLYESQFAALKAAHLLAAGGIVGRCARYASGSGPCTRRQRMPCELAFLIGQAGIGRRLISTISNAGNENMADKGNAGNEPELKSGYRLDDRQNEAVAALAGAKNYGTQSKWATFKSLPAHEKWPYFAQHFLPGIAVIVVVVAFMGAMAWQMLFNRVDTVIGVQAINLQQYSAGFDNLKNGFAKASDKQIKDERELEFGDTMTITKDGAVKSTGMMDDSAKLAAMASAKELNVLFSSANDVSVLNQRGVVQRLDKVLTREELDDALQAGIVVDGKGRPTDDRTKAYGVVVSADSSRIWEETEGLPDEAVLMFGNLQDQQRADWAARFYDYLLTQ